MTTAKQRLLVPEGMSGQQVIDTLLDAFPGYDGPRPQRSTASMPCACGGDDAALQSNDGGDSWFVLCSGCGAMSPQAQHPVVASSCWSAGSRVALPMANGRVLADGVLLAQEEWDQLCALGGNPLRTIERIVAFYLGVMAGAAPLPPEKGGGK